MGVVKMLCDVSGRVVCWLIFFVRAFPLLRLIGENIAMVGC